MNKITLLDEKSEEIKTLQKWLPTLRKCAGWSGEEFGQLIGMSKQSVHYLESKTTKMTKLQYIAIRSVLEYEAMTDKKDNELFVTAVKLTFNDEITEEQRTKAMPLVAGAKQTNMKSSELNSCIAALTGIVVGALAAVTGFLIADNVNNKNNK